jgi:hypothetical protein|tara:strand:+ start:911 stop:1312 length:402 start_codon:yes stop_codon:yes gene_type:complete
MAHFAKLNNDNIVTQVIVVHNNELLVDGVENEQKGIDFINDLYKTSDNWKQTSYNTNGGVHTLGGTPFRKNYAGKGMIYDEGRDAFRSKQLYPSWTLNETTCRWEPPVAYPDDDNLYTWDESTQNWLLQNSLT